MTERNRLADMSFFSSSFRLLHRCNQVKTLPNSKNVRNKQRKQGRESEYSDVNNAIIVFSWRGRSSIEHRNEFKTIEFSLFHLLFTLSLG
jgi:hypothetical protein